jgi:hypothetical protein
MEVEGGSYQREAERVEKREDRVIEDMGTWRE